MSRMEKKGNLQEFWQTLLNLLTVKTVVTVKIIAEIVMILMRTKVFLFDKNKKR